MLSKSVVSPEDQSVTFVELFFDLVFVFSVTQVVSILHHDLDLLHVGQAILVFWLVWWAWTQYTWALNAADTTHPLVELGTLLATAIAFFMAVTVPDAFQGGALAFAFTFVLVRGLGLILYLWVTVSNPHQREAVRNFSLLSLAGLATALLGGLAGGTLQYVLWGATILLDIAAAILGGRAESWNIHPDHFSERHGLFVIIALGETLIVAAAGLTGAVWSGTLIVVAVLAVAVTSGLWWTYFAQAKPLLDHALAHAHGARLAMMARDTYSLIHFPLLCGVIGYAVAVEAAVAQPDAPLEPAVRLALLAGLVLFVGGTSLALWRATRHFSVPGLATLAVTAVVLLALPDAPASVSLAVVLVGLVVIAFVAKHPVRQLDLAESANI